MGFIKLRIAIIILVLLSLAGSGIFYFYPKQESENKSFLNQEASPEYKTILAQDVSGSASEFNFSAEIPAGWNIEAIPQNESLNIYNSGTYDSVNLENSQIFIRHFEANAFLTLNTVDILERGELIIKNRPAVKYTIKKRDNIPDFPNQPKWRNELHSVTDIRVSDKNPSVFLVIAKSPELSEEIFEHFLNTLILEPETSSDFIEPIAEFKSRITKKSFGIYITPDNSSVSPERFQGYHTGVDVEYGDVLSEVPVRAVSDGEVVLSDTVSGYGGVLVIRHNDVFSLYGHLDPKSLIKAGEKVSAGREIGILGEGNSAETDGERKHLHFAISKEMDIRGYVALKSELGRWHNPLDFY